MNDRTSLFPWPGGAAAAVSITFDDTRPTQLDAGVPILDRHGVRGTFYATLRTLEDRADDWRAAAGRGHEIGNHTTTHPCTGNFAFVPRGHALENYTPEQIERDILDAGEAIHELIGTEPTTFAYPCGQSFVGRGVNLQSYIPVVAKHFVVGRGWMCESVADPAFCDLAYLPAVELDGIGWEQARAVLDKAIEEGRWLVFAGHDVRPTGRQAVRPDVLDRLCAYCTDPKNGVWIDTVAAIGPYVQSQQTHSLQTQGKD